MRCATLVVLGVLCAGGLSADPLLCTVRLMAEAQTAGDWVTLGEVATTEPAAAAVALGSIPVAPAPLPGSSRSVTLGYIKLRLRGAGVDLSKTSFAGPGQVLVSRVAGPAVAAIAPPAPAGSAASALVPGIRSLPAAAVPANFARSGALIRLVVRNGPLTVETTGELLKACAIGELSHFRVSGTRAVVTGRLVEPTLAEVIR